MKRMILALLSFTYAASAMAACPALEGKYFCKSADLRQPAFELKITQTAQAIYWQANAESVQGPYPFASAVSNYYNGVPLHFSVSCDMDDTLILLGKTFGTPSKTQLLKAFRQTSGGIEITHIDSRSEIQGSCAKIP